MLNVNCHQDEEAGLSVLQKLQNKHSFDDDFYQVSKIRVYNSLS